jgi:hypothetical protein
MAIPNYIQKSLVMKPEVTKIFDDLDAYRDFCVEYGHVFNEKHLYEKKSPWGDMQRLIAGKKITNIWELNGKK